MSGGGKGSSAPVVAYRYGLGIHIGICHGPVDSIRELISADRTVPMWAPLFLTGGVTSGTMSGVGDGPDIFIGYSAITWTSSAILPTNGSLIKGKNIPADARIYNVTATGGTLRDKNGNTVLVTGAGTGLTFESFQAVSTITESQTLHISAEDLFGGDTREGGLFGYVDVTMGESDQVRNTYLQGFQGADCPAYRGILSLVFKSFLWTSGNPYIKPIWIKVSRILQGWDGGTAWYAAKAVVNTYDMNAAHIVYECMTNGKWGMGYSAVDMDDTNWRAAADTLYSEGFGLSMAWAQQSTVNDFVQLVMNHINGAVYLDMTTGKFCLKLIRDDYVVGDLTVLDESNIIEITSFSRSGYGDLVNELVVNYTDRSENTKPISVQNLAAIQSQGGVVSSSVSYIGIREPELAARVAMRDLALISTPLAKLSLVTNRVLWEHEKGGVVAVHWVDHGLDGVPFRIIDIDKGTLQNSRITVELVEDVFGLPLNAYTDAPDSQWAGEAVVDPVAVEAARAIEVPFWEIERGMRRADISQLIPDFGFGTVLAVRGVDNFPFQYSLVASQNDVVYRNNTIGHFCPTGVLSVAVNRVETVFAIEDFYDLDNVVFDYPDNGYAYIGDECVAIVSVNTAGGEVNVRRAVLDTVPAEHSIGDRMYFVTNAVAYDQTERVAGEVVYYKPLPTTGKGTLAAADATALSLTLNNRASRPYPPGNFKINGTHFPATVAGAMTVSWSSRDRTMQSVTLVDFTQGNIGPETNVVARLRLYDGGILLREKIGGNGFDYSSAEEIADGLVTPLRLVLDSVTYDPWNILYATYSGEALEVVAHSSTPTDVCIDSAFSTMLILDYTGHVHQYGLTVPGDISSAAYIGSLDVSADDNHAQGIAMSADGTTLYVVGDVNKTVNSYILLTPWDVSSAIATGVLVGIDFNTDGTMMYLLSVNTGTVNQYRLTDPWNAGTASYISSSMVLHDIVTLPSGGVMSKDGTKLFIIGNEDTVHMFTLSTPWQIETVTDSGVTFSVAVQTATARDIAFNVAGTSMYIVGASASPIYDYTLSTAWDISSAAYLTTHTNWAAVPGYPVGGETIGEPPVVVGGQDATPLGIAFSEDGYTMYMVGSATAKIYQYSLTHPWRVSTAVFSGLSATVILGSPVAVALDNTGRKMLVTCTNGLCYEYLLPVAWMVGNAAYTGRFTSFAVQESSVKGVAFDESGLYILTVGAGHTLHQYSMFKEGALESLYKHDWTVTRTF